ncbi:MAG: hypothetical protein L0312_20185 [Acidobacteria bacterium]|nr:hypothetical protein [Acidobacteriota bacterium]
MRFSVIYSVDTQAGVLIGQYRPKSRIWQMTERGRSEYEYLGEDWEKGQHRKFCAVLNQKSFDLFVERFHLFAESTRTMGSLGAPGLGLGMSPAISFRGEESAAILSAYVTPHGDPYQVRNFLRANEVEVPGSLMKSRNHKYNQKIWEAVREAMIHRYS